MYFFDKSPRPIETLPKTVISSYVKTPDGINLEVWKLPTKTSKPVVVIFHGNAADIVNFFPYQEYFSNLGMTSYGVDYRGYGKSTGWPSESGLEIDATSAIDFIKTTENITSKDLVIVGISLGTGVASFAATKYSPPCLILFSPFTSIPEVIKSKNGIGFLHIFSLTQMPVAKNVASLNETSTIVIHGEMDNVIPLTQGQKVFQNAKGKYSGMSIIKNASHNDILLNNHEEASQKILECISHSYSSIS